MADAKQAHEEYWRNERLLVAGDYERNEVLPFLFRKGERVLDVGCGDGAVTSYLQDSLGCKVIGLDFSAAAVNKARQRGIEAVLANVDKGLPIKSASIGTIFFGDVIEHIYDPEGALREIHRVLKDGGRLIVSCPNMGYWRYRISYAVHGIFPETEWIEAELWRSQHIRFFNETLLLRLLRKTGFTPKRFFGVSRRRLDRPLLKRLPSLFGMIMVIEARKQ